MRNVFSGLRGTRYPLRCRVQTQQQQTQQVSSTGAGSRGGGSGGGKSRSPPDAHTSPPDVISSDVTHPNDDDDDVTLKPMPPALADALRACVAATLARGPLLGYPLVGLRVTLLEDACEVSGDSTPAAVRTAVARALEAALRDASPQLLEPVMAVDVTVPTAMAGDAVSELSGHRRGRIQGIRPAGVCFDGGEEGEGGAAPGPSSLPTKSVVSALVPLREMVGFSTPLRSRTAGEGSFSMAFAHYAPVGPVLQRAMIANPAAVG